MKDTAVVENETVKKLKEENKQLDDEIEKLEKDCLVKVSQLYLMAQMVSYKFNHSIVKLNLI